jgi:alanyl-tRNA synthetase
MRNHSACHLLQSALRRVLGNHVEQSGSYVSDTVCRFDFTHFSAMTAEEIASVEIMLEQLKIINHCYEKVQKFRELKIRKLYQKAFDIKEIIET